MPPMPVLSPHPSSRPSHRASRPPRFGWTGRAGWTGWPGRVARPGPAGLAVAGLALGSFVVSLVLQHTLYRYGSGDADEAAYVMQARMLLDGRLTLDAASVEPFFRPWLTGEVDGRVFTKYLPGWPAALAASQLLFGTMTVAPAAVAAAWVVGAYRLGRELFDDRAVGVVAAVLVACSPLVLLHTALPLAYAFTAATATLASAALVRGVRPGPGSTSHGSTSHGSTSRGGIGRGGIGPGSIGPGSTGRRRSLCLAGAGFGLALLTRPLDAVLVAIGGLLFVATCGVAAWRRLPWAVLGGLPFVALLLAYNTHVTGSPTRLPIPASDPLDTFGFGERRIMIGEPTFSFSRRASYNALVETVQTVPGWLFGGILLVVLVAVGLFAPGRRAARLMLAGTVVLVLGTYLFWWGSAFAVPGLRDGLGPHYHLAAFTPLLLLGARGAVTGWSASCRLASWLATRLASSLASSRPAAALAPRLATAATRPAVQRVARPVAVVLVVVAFVLATAPSVSRKIDVQRAVKGSTVYVQGLVPDDLPGPAVVVVTPDRPSRFTQVPYHTLRNDPALTGPVLFAADLGAATVGLPDRVPGRALYRLRPAELLDATAPWSYQGSFVELHVVEGRALTLTVEVAGTGAAGTGAAGTGAAGAGAAGTGAAGAGAAGAGVAGTGAAGAGAAVATRPGEAYVKIGGVVQSVPLTPTVSGSRIGTVTVGLAPAADLGPNGFSLLGASLPAELAVGFVAGGLYDPVADRWEQRFPLGAAGPDSGPGPGSDADADAGPGPGPGPDSGPGPGSGSGPGLGPGPGPGSGSGSGSGAGAVRVLAPGLGWQIVHGRYDNAWVPATVGSSLAVTAVTADAAPPVSGG